MVCIWHIRSVEELKEALPCTRFISHQRILEVTHLVVYWKYLERHRSHDDVLEDTQHVLSLQQTEKTQYLDHYICWTV